MHPPKPFFESLENRRLMASTASIAGFVFNDANANTKREAKETGIAQVTVYLDKNNNSKLDSAEKKTITSSAGAFSFTALSSGAYIVRQLVPKGYSQTTPTKNYGVHVTLKSGQKITNRLLGDVLIVQPPPPVVITPAEPFWPGFGGDPQHTGISPVATQELKKLKWSTTVDLAPQFSGESLLIHYGSPVFTKKNTVIVGVKTQAAGAYRLEARSGTDGKLLWQQATDYILPPHTWTPAFQPAIAPNGRVYFAGPGGTVYWRDNLDGASGNTGQIAFYGLANYTANKASLDANVFIDTPITIDKSGNLFFGIQVSGANPLNLKGGLVRISAAGVGTAVAATTVTSDVAINKVQQNCAPALSNDGSIVYVSMNQTAASSSGTHGFLVALNSTTLATIATVRLIDPSNSADARVADISTASPTIGPDGDVYFGVLESGTQNHRRGFMLHFSSDLATTKTPGSFGWDDTCSIVPKAMVPSYTGESQYLIMAKYNNYSPTGGDGINKLAILDPNDTQIDPTTGATVMKEVLTVVGPTPDPEYVEEYPGAVKEWCVNFGAVDPATSSVLVNSEDGKLYRWDLITNKLSQNIALHGGIGEAYTPTAIGPDGTVYAINKGILWAVGT